jgi:hypothetical protein
MTSVSAPRVRIDGPSIHLIAGWMDHSYIARDAATPLLAARWWNLGRLT